MPAPPATAPWDWIVALTFISSFFAAFGNGANDVANSYATSVAARTLKMWHVGILAMITEFLGAFALGERVTNTIKNGIIAPDRFFGQPAVFMLTMSCAEMANASWLMFATKISLPVSTTQTIVGALVGAGIATNTPVTWGWESGSVSQIAASWIIAPSISAVLSAALFATIKYAILERKGEGEAFKWALRLIPFYLAFTGGILALFIVIEAPLTDDLEDLGAGTAVGIIFGTFFGVLAIAYIFFKPYFERRLVKNDPRIQWYHIPLGLYLRKDDPWLYWPSKNTHTVINYYEDAYGNVTAGANDAANSTQPAAGNAVQRQPYSDEEPSASEQRPQVPREASSSSDDSTTRKRRSSEIDPTTNPSDLPAEDAQKLAQDIEKHGVPSQLQTPRKAYIPPYERFIGPVKDLSWANPRKWLGWVLFLLLRGVTTDVITHDSALLRSIHARAHRYDDRIEHLWTYCQVASAMMSSLAHGSNDVANAIGPLVAVYETWLSGEVETETGTRIWILAIAGIALGLGFWFFGYNIMRAVGNRITQMSPIRGFSVELGSAITVLMASRLALPVSTTQCLVGSSLGVALMNYDLRAVNWRQLAWIFMGWAITLPCAALISGLLVVTAVNTPRFGMQSV